jgi:hypothetical protein
MIRDHTLHILGGEKKANEALENLLLSTPSCNAEPRRRKP